jgi:hypothetical protein
VLFVVSFAIGAGNVLFTTSQVHQAGQNTLGVQRANARLQMIIARQEQQIRADCDFYGDLAGLPLADAANGYPSELGVKIISDTRAAWHGHGCAGKLAPPDPTFVAGAHHYRLPVN